LGTEWRSNRLRANGGKIAVDYFANAKTLVKVTYDSRGRILEATHYNGRRELGVAKYVGPRDNDKLKTVVGWLKAESK
jgi:YD repeat-containing protein